MKLLLASLTDIPEETANRMMVAHGSRSLLCALRGEPLPLVPTNRNVPLVRLLKPRPPAAPRLPRSARPAMPMPAPIARILAGVAEAFELTLADLRGHCRNTHYVNARRIAAKLLRDRLGRDGLPIYSYPRIGEYLNRDHSSIINLLDGFEARCRDPKLQAVYQALSVRFAS